MIKKSNANISANITVDNYEPESNLDLSLGESFSSNINPQESKFGNPLMNSNFNVKTPRNNLVINENKIENNLDKILNSNINNLNALNNSSKDASDSANKNSGGLNNIQQNSVNNRFDNDITSNNTSSLNNNLNNKDLDIVKEQHNTDKEILNDNLINKVILF